MKKSLFLLIAIALSVSLSACGGAATSPAPETSSTPAPEASTVSEFDLSEYKALVSDCCDDIMNLSILYSNMGKYEYNYWKSLNSVNGSMDYDSMVAKAEEWLSEKGNTDAETLSNNYNDICDQYKNIIEIDVSGTEAESILSDFDKYYEAFNGLHILVTAPSGDIDSFSTNFNSYSDDIQNYNSILETSLSD